MKNENTSLEQRQRSCSIIVLSCDAYSDTWVPFISLFEKFWPDCPFSAYFITNGTPPPPSRFKPVFVEESRAWAGKIAAALDAANTEYTLYLQDDYFLESSVDTKRLLEVVAWMQRRPDVAVARLAGGPDPDTDFDNPFGFGAMRPGAAYRVSTQSAIWRTSVLRALLVPGESVWDMELKGSRRSDSLESIFAGTYKRRPLFPYYRNTAIKRGAWLSGAIALCRRHGIPIDTSRRPVRSSARLTAVRTIRELGSRIRRSIRVFLGRTR